MELRKNGCSGSDAGMKTSLNNERTLKVETAGDYYSGRIFPKIRLQGKWLEASGFKADGRVAVRSEKPGELVLRFISFEERGTL